MPEITAPDIAIDTSELIDMRPAESHEDEAPRLADNLHWRKGVMADAANPPHSHTCQGHCGNHAQASDDIEAKVDLILANEAEEFKRDYIVHLLTIADEHASTGDDLGCSPVWKTARRLAPVFGLEKNYA